MSPDLVFQLCNLGVLPAWALLVFAPRWRVTASVVHAIWLPLGLALVYAIGAVAGPPAPEGGGFGSLEGVMLLFTSPHVALIGWVHYLVFDLFVGAWQARDAARREIPHLWVVPCLLLTFMAGPLGLLAYLALRYWRARAVSLAEAIV